MKALGYKLLNNKSTFWKDGKGFLNDQVWYKNVELKLKTQLDPN